ncbi:MAG: hypothetical protein SGJ11_15900 [Phycisphaerae bacterium]|nr:hypothetical protein [Phycisphaerae bacterium]
MSNGPGPGSAGNVLAAICSLFIPGLGQLVQGRILVAIIMFVLSGVVWVLTFGFGGIIMHIIACVEAALWKGR